MIAELGHFALILAFAVALVQAILPMIGATAGYLVLWSVYWLFKLATGKEGMGFGDFKLLAAIGAWLGWKLLPFVVLASSAIGALVATPLARRFGALRAGGDGRAVRAGHHPRHGAGRACCGVQCNCFAPPGHISPFEGASPG